MGSQIVGIYGYENSGEQGFKNRKIRGSKWFLLLF